MIESSIIENWETKDEPEHLRTIRNRLLQNEKQLIKLLSTYRQILQKGEIESNGSFEQVELRLSGLVVARGKLRICNRIYKTIFNELWIDDLLVNLRPYSEIMASWIASNNQDESRLLKGVELEKALVWSTGKDLSSQDYRFLITSFDQEKSNLQKSIEQIDFVTIKLRQRAKYITGNIIENLKDAIQRSIDETEITYVDLLNRNNLIIKLNISITKTIEEQAVKAKMSIVEEFKKEELEELLRFLESLTVIKRDDLMSFDVNYQIASFGSQAGIDIATSSTKSLYILLLPLLTSIFPVLIPIFIGAIAAFGGGLKNVKDKIKKQIMYKIENEIDNIVRIKVEQQLNSEISNLSETLKGLVQKRIDFLSKVYQGIFNYPSKR